MVSESVSFKLLAGVSFCPQWTHCSNLLLHLVTPCFLFFYRLLQNIEYSSLCYTVSPCWLSILYIVCVFLKPKLLICPSPTISPLVTLCFLRLWVYFCFFHKFICIIFISHVNDIIWYVFVWPTSLGMKISGCIHVAANGIISSFFMAE